MLKAKLLSLSLSKNSTAQPYTSSSPLAMHFLMNSTIETTPGKTDTRALNPASSVISRGLQVPPVSSHEVCDCRGGQCAHSGLGEGGEHVKYWRCTELVLYSPLSSRQGGGEVSSRPKHTSSLVPYRLVSYRTVSYYITSYRSIPYRIVSYRCFKHPQQLHLLSFHSDVECAHEFRQREH